MYDLQITTSDFYMTNEIIDWITIGHTELISLRRGQKQVHQALPPALLVNAPLHAPEAYETPLQPSAAFPRPSYGYYDLEFDSLDTIVHFYL